MFRHWKQWAGLLFLALIIALVILLTGINSSSASDSHYQTDTDRYVVLAWNDLGMHCYNRDFKDLAVLPPYNSLWAQVVKVGDPPQLITTGVNLTYAFPDNTYSVGKSNFWDFDQALFGVDLPPNVGLTGKGMAGSLDLHGDYFAAEGIPLTEFSDSDLINPYPYQLADVVAFDTASGQELSRITTVAPVSTEMNCNECHYDGALEGIATGGIETNILALHDLENMDAYPPGHEGALMDRRPILCAECHASNALAAPGIAGIPNLSNAIHDTHATEVPSSIDGCYLCHPGPQTSCLRGVMAADHNMDCADCHGGMSEVAANNEPWLNEPRCDNEACHGSAYQQDQALYRLSKEHGGIYCAACHDSPHAIAPTSEANDGLKFIALQGYNDTLGKCTVCHASTPTGEGPHGITVSPTAVGISEFNAGSSIAPFWPLLLLLSTASAGVIFHHRRRQHRKSDDI